MRRKLPPVRLGVRLAFVLIAVLSARPATALFWVPVGPPGNPPIVAMAVGHSDYSVPLNLPPSLLLRANEVLE